MFSSSPIGSLVRISGTDPRYSEIYDHYAYLPSPLPNRLTLSQDTYTRVAQATAAVGRLDQAALRLPNPQLLIRPAIRREAVSTSALEGTYAALDDVLEADFLEERQLTSSVAEVTNYVRAAELAFTIIADQPITIGMLSALQKVLLKNTKGDTPEAGHIRDTQVFIGSASGRVHEARFIPPPPGDQLRSGVDAWVEWINGNDDIPILVRMALGHYQFESLHPFNDGRTTCSRSASAASSTRGSSSSVRRSARRLSAPWKRSTRCTAGVTRPWKSSARPAYAE